MAQHWGKLDGSFDGFTQSLFQKYAAGLGKSF
jgi:capsid protein